MPRINGLFRAAVMLAGCLGVLLAVAGNPARAEPPIRSAEDAACRTEAKARVFSTPNPRGLEPEVVGRQIYFACMDRLAKPKTRHRRHRRR